MQTRFRETGNTDSKRDAVNEEFIAAQKDNRTATIYIAEIYSALYGASSENSRFPVVRAVAF